METMFSFSMSGRRRRRRKRRIRRLSAHRPGATSSHLVKIKKFKKGVFLPFILLNNKAVVYCCDLFLAGFHVLHGPRPQDVGDCFDSKDDPDRLGHSNAQSVKPQVSTDLG
jgi:hypothetical protein